jgi:hypothetical protein
LQTFIDVHPRNRWTKVQEVAQSRYGHCRPRAGASCACSALRPRSLAVAARDERCSPPENSVAHATKAVSMPMHQVVDLKAFGNMSWCSPVKKSDGRINRSSHGAGRLAEGRRLANADLALVDEYRERIASLTLTTRGVKSANAIVGAPASSARVRNRAACCAGARSASRSKAAPTSSRSDRSPS